MQSCCGGADGGGVVDNDFGNRKYSSNMIIIIRNFIAFGSDWFVHLLHVRLEVNIEVWNRLQRKTVATQL